MLAIAASIFGGLTYLASASSCPAVDGVNSFIGTGGLAYGYGGVNPGAQYPSGPLRLGPDSTNTVANIGSFYLVCIRVFQVYYFACCS